MTSEPRLILTLRKTERRIEIDLPDVLDANYEDKLLDCITDALQVMRGNKKSVCDIECYTA